MLLFSVETRKILVAL